MVSVIYILSQPYPKVFTDQCCKRKWRLLASSVGKNTPKIFKTKNARLIMQRKFIECGFKKSQFVKKTNIKKITLGVKAPLSKTSLLNAFF